LLWARLEDQVKWSLGGAAEARESTCGHDLAQARFTSVECRTYFVQGFLQETL
jgi:hypothetical protein